MKNSASRLVCSSFALVITACGSDTGDGDDTSIAPRDGGVARDAGEEVEPPRDGGPPALDPTDAADRIAGAFCAYARRCQSANLDYFALDEASCPAFAAAHLEPLFTTARAAADDGRLSYDAAALDACVAELEQHACAPRPSNICADFLLGTRAPGEACRFDLECAGGYCDTADAATSCGYPAVLSDLASFMCMNTGDVCAACVAYAGVNASCDGVRCGADLRCANLGTQANPDLRCLRRDLGVGQTCFTTTSGFCAFGLHCVGPSGMSTCVVDAAEGETCATGNDLPLAAPRCGNGLLCEGGTCQPYSVSGLGEACDNTGRLCPLGSFCSNASICVALPSGGEPCLQNLCDPDHICVGNTCAPRSAEGSACTSGGECATGLACTGATTGRCGAVQWEVCE